MNTISPHIIISGIIIASVLSCSTRPDAGEFLQPEVSRCEVVLDGYMATFSCSVRGGSRITLSGFALSVDGGKETRTDVALSEGRMSLNVKRLVPEAEYSVRAYASNGRNEVFGPETTFVVEETDPVVRIPDGVFREYCLANFDRDGDGLITRTEAVAVDEIIVCTDKINSLEGIESFPNLKHLSGNGSEGGDGIRSGKLTHLDLRENKRLRHVELYGNNLKELLLPESYSDIEEIQCSLNWIESLDLSGCPKLKSLYCWDNNLTELDLSCNPSLQNLECAQNYFYGGLDLSANKELTSLYCNDDCLQELDLKGMTRLTELGFWGNDLKSVDLSDCANLSVIEGHDTPLESLDLSSCKDLRILSVGHTDIRDIDVSMCPDLEAFDVGWTKVSSIDVTHNPLLQHFSSCDTNLDSCPDLSNNPLLTSIHLWGKGGIVYVPEDFFRSWPDVESINIGCYDKNRLDLSLNTKLRDVWADCLQNIHYLDLSASPGLEHISIRYSGCLDTVFVHPSVDLSKLNIEMRDDEVATKFVHKR